MAELRIRLDVGFSRSSLRGTMVAVLLLAFSPELGSETVTLSTYYPAPSGVYTKMISTQDTWLARDSGNVGIGTASPQAKLDVNGLVRVGNYGADPGSGVNGAIYYNTNTNMFRGYKGGVWGDLGGGPWMEDTANNAVYLADTNRRVGLGPSMGRFPAAPLDVNGVIMARQAASGASGGSCVNTEYKIAGQTPCPGGYYATTISGLLTKYQMMPLYQTDEDTKGTTAKGQMWCCQCPTGGCPNPF